MPRNRAQAFSVDLLVALALFYVVLTAFVTTYGSLSGNREFPETSLRLATAKNYLLSSEGYPAGWNAANAQEIGLAEKPGTISEDKLAAFLNLSSTSIETVKEKLGVSDYALFFGVYYANGSAVTVNDTAFVGNAEFGSISGSTAAAVNATALYRGEKAFLRMVLSK